MQRNDSALTPFVPGVAARRWKIARYVPVAVATAIVAAYAIRAVLAKCGHPAVPLDDAFIHFQYAKRLAQGHFFSYVDGEGYSSGATSLLWPMLLAPLYRLGLDDVSLIWGAWALGFAALGALSLETYRLAVPLAGRGASVGAAAMVPSFGGYVFGAASGMEVVPLALILAFSLRKCIEWGEALPEDRRPEKRRLLVALAFIAPLVRPEGTLISVLVAAMLARFRASPPRALPRARVLARTVTPVVLALSGALAVPLLHFALTGHITSSTTVVKWLPGNPYYGEGEALYASVGENVRLFFDSIIDGREWSAVYLPAGSRPFAIGGLVSLPTAGWFRRRPLRGWLVLGMALAMLIPCTYYTFLWNRLRYLWPFAFAWFIGLACLARSLADAGTALSRNFRVFAPVMSGLFAGALASHLGWTLDDLASSASAIDRQQVALGRWAASALAPSARIGVNDTGAISYLGDRPTFDIVGLTTPGEAKYWVAGPGSRFEHYERLSRETPDRLPTHFIVYPHWLGCDAILGDELYRATVLDQTILGGTTMLAFVARYDTLGSGERPMLAASARIRDDLDVADLESEAAHRYEIGRTRETENQALSYESDGVTITDGTRLGRAFDRFVLRGEPGVPLRLVARFVAKEPVTLEARINDVVVGTFAVGSVGFVEGSLDVPPELVTSAMSTTVAAPAGSTFGSAHYWLADR